MKSLSCLLLLVSLLAGCDRLGLPDPAKEAEAKDAEGKAIGSACRQSGRALEDCFALNPSAIKASIFSGWRDMNDYMQQNKIEVVKPELVGAQSAAAKSKTEKADADANSSDDADSDEDSGDTKRPAAASKPSSRRPAKGESGAH
jgi:hypothetical protein